MPSKVDENELKVIEAISESKDHTQRSLSHMLDLSLGSVNLILKRLAKRGLVKTKGLTQKKIEYLLTPKGFSEKARKSYNYVLKTIGLVKIIRDEIAKVVQSEYNRGQRKFVVFGDDDLADVIELALKGFDYQRVNSLSEIRDKNALVLMGRTKVRAKGFRTVYIASKLRGIYWGVEQKRKQP